MTFFDDIALGRHAPAGSVIHGLDPRLKLVLFPLLIVASFTAPTFVHSLILLATATFFVVLSRIGTVLYLRGVFAFRWLFLFMILLHALFSPGRTLFGTEWISLDGLFRGGEAVLRLALAITFSTILTLTTAPGELASALSALFTPLGRFGFPAEAASRRIFLVLHFIPIIRDEGAALMPSSPLVRNEATRSSLSERGRGIAHFLDTLLTRLFASADSFAVEIVSKGDSFPEPNPLPPFRPLSACDLKALIAVSVVLLLLVCL